MIDLPKQLRETQPEDLPVSAGNLMDMAADEIERLRAALKKYGRHLGTCHDHGGKDCNCGWETIKRDILAHKIEPPHND